jgi:chemotaxis protein methyltransferase CheR
MVLMEEIQEGQTSMSLSLGDESIVGWMGDRLSSFCGLQISQEQTPKISGIVRKRMMVHSLLDPIQYFQLVESQSEEGVAEWEQLLALFMNGETFFFRDSGQFRLLKEHILPTLIHHRKAVRSLRILSAGCSTGEEAYSLAILVDQLLPDRQNWDIEILGMDINFRSIQHAKQGIYGQWAFRNVDSGLQSRYFLERGSQWVLNEPIRKMVTFRMGNIFADSIPSLAFGGEELDLIVCRNVFLYFHAEAIERAVDTMTGTLASDGYFLTGHGELPAQAVRTLDAKVFPDSVIYQRPQTLCAMSHGDRL